MTTRSKHGLRVKITRNSKGHATSSPVYDSYELLTYQDIIDRGDYEVASDSKEYLPLAIGISLICHDRLLEFAEASNSGDTERADRLYKQLCSDVKYLSTKYDPTSRSDYENAILNHNEKELKRRNR
jgi:hypothetical protein